VLRFDAFRTDFKSLEIDIFRIRGANRFPYLLFAFLSGTSFGCESVDHCVFRSVAISKSSRFFDGL
jgi:hypothetical protein